MTHEEIETALTDRQAVVATLYGECRNQPLDGQVAVAWVIRNRVEHPGSWGRDYKSVCLAPKQFSCWLGSSENTAAVWALAEGLVLASPTLAIVEQLGWVADGVMGGFVVDPTHGSTNYLTHALWTTAPPSWARGEPRVTVGDHVFFA